MEQLVQKNTEKIKLNRILQVSSTLLKEIRKEKTA